MEKEISEIETINNKIEELNSSLKKYNKQLENLDKDNKNDIVIIGSLKSIIEDINNDLINSKKQLKSIEGNQPLKLDKILEKLEEEYKFMDNYFFLDLELGKYVLIDMKEEQIHIDANNHKNIEYIKSTSIIDKGNIEDLIKTQLTILQKKGLIDKTIDRYDDKIYKKIKQRVMGMFQKFDRNKHQIFISKNTPVLNKFLTTDITEYIPIKLINYNKLREELKQYKRLEIILNNNVCNDEKSLKYLLNWISAEMNTPQNMHTSIVLIGEQGSGKSLLTETIFKENIYHRTNVAIMDNKSWIDKFNSIFEDKTFLINNEISLTDRKESNDIAENIKRLISDKTIMIRGMQKENIEKWITFSMWFLSNKNEPIKIENGDRRLSVFGRAEKLEKNRELIKFLEENNETLDEFIKEFKQEVKEFLFILKSLEFDRGVCKKPIETTIKSEIIMNTNTKIDTLKSAFNTQNINSFDNLLDSYDFDEDDKQKALNMFKVGIFENTMLKKIYELFFPDATPEKSGRWWNQIITNVKGTLTINTKQYSYKVFNTDNLEEKRVKLRSILLDEDFEEAYQITPPKDKEMMQQSLISKENNSEMPTLELEIDEDMPF